MKLTKGVSPGAQAIALDPAHDGLCVLPVTHFPIQRSWQVVWRQDRRLPRIATVFMDFVRRELATAVAP